MILLLLCTQIKETKAQQDPLYTQYMFNTLAFNPAYAGSRGTTSIMALSRHQWVGFEGAPTTQTITGHMPLGNIGLGMSIIHDKLSPANQTGVYFDYAYRIRTSENSHLSFGLKGGFNHFQLDVAQLLLASPNDPALTNIGLTSKYLPNFGFGLYWYSDKYFFGVSIPKLMENKLVNGDIEILGQAGAEVRHYFASAGFVFSLGEEVKVKPTILSRFTQAAPLSLDANLNFLFKEKLWVGAMYRMSDSFGGILQYQFTPQFRIGYAYDMTNNEFRNYNNGTHEIMISYELNFTKGKVQNPRYF
ncbi:PorP/SprF family type IX secretion system membrane protein [Carboxylicivirga caseinilyticus]|uniref:PorP/SprF family type IX secretion system membrane protein n=1 Tax=Carboxylicivirga caseinilyticus TaxID=3417572 RepID=UPI003D342528|nr:type IX secretion system membrane protein PorP/SprF [Marinilabiliaceae bacterium A049]